MSNLTQQEKNVNMVLHSVTNRFQPIAVIVAIRLSLSLEDAKVIIHNILIKENK